MRLFLHHILIRIVILHCYIEYVFRLISIGILNYLNLTFVDWIYTQGSFVFKLRYFFKNWAYNLQLFILTHRDTLGRRSRRVRRLSNPNALIAAIKVIDQFLQLWLLLVWYNIQYGLFLKILIFLINWQFLLKEVFLP